MAQSENLWELAAEIRGIVEKSIAARIRQVADDPDRVRPRRKDALFATDLVTDMEWAAMIAEGSWPAGTITPGGSPAGTYTREAIEE